MWAKFAWKIMQLWAMHKTAGKEKCWWNEKKKKTMTYILHSIAQTSYSLLAQPSQV